MHSPTHSIVLNFIRVRARVRVRVRAKVRITLGSGLGSARVRVRVAPYYCEVGRCKWGLSIRHKSEQANGNRWKQMETDGNRWKLQTDWP